MTVRVRWTVRVAVSSDDREEDDLGLVEKEVVVDALGEGGSWKTYIPPTTTDMVLQLTGMTSAKFILLHSQPRLTTDDPQELSVKLNGTGNTAIPLKALSTSREGLLVLSSSGITSIHVTNSSAVGMDLTVALVGD